VLASDGTTQLDEHFDLDGWRVGAGVEKAFGKNTYGKLEYRYSNYSNGRLTFANGATTSNFDVDTDKHQIVAGFGIRF
jgi:outer membrane immunogenic protein